MSLGKIKEKITEIQGTHRNICKRLPRDFNDKGFFNRYFGEILPLMILAEYCDATMLQFNGKDESIDGYLFFNNSTKRQSIECTLAIDGQERNHQLQHLSLYSDAPCFNKIATNRATKASKKKEIINTELEVVTSEERIDLLKPFLTKAIANKIRKDNKSYIGAWLIVTFMLWDDYHLKDTELNAWCNEIIPPEKHPFEKIFIIGYRGSEQAFIYESK